MCQLECESEHKEVPGFGNQTLTMLNICTFHSSLLFKGYYTAFSTILMINTLNRKRVFAHKQYLFKIAAKPNTVSA